MIRIEVPGIPPDRSQSSAQTAPSDAGKKTEAFDLKGVNGNGMGKNGDGFGDCLERLVH
jgi:hypothetical protein